MDFSRIKTTDDLVPHFPPPDEENNLWEFKNAKVLSKSEIAAKLGKAVSAFANTGGGYLVFGVHATTGDLQPCPQMFGTVTTKDWLASRVEASVDVAIQDFTIHKIPIASQPTECIYVVQIGDSQAAPHQSRHDTQYFYRLDGQSKPAPHFHLELLRSRYTRAVLKITGTRFVVDVPVYRRPHGIDEFNQPAFATILTLKIFVEVQNASLTCADKWGVLVKVIDSPLWSAEPDGYGPSGVIRPEVKHILPEEKQQVCVPVSTIIKGGNHYMAMFERFKQLRVEFKPVSQNFVGETAVYDNSIDPELQKITFEHFKQQVESLELGKN